MLQMDCILFDHAVNRTMVRIENSINLLADTLQQVTEQLLRVLLCFCVYIYIYITRNDSSKHSSPTLTFTRLSISCNKFVTCVGESSISDSFSFSRYPNTPAQSSSEQHSTVPEPLLGRARGVRRLRRRLSQDGLPLPGARTTKVTPPLCPVSSIRFVFYLSEILMVHSDCCHTLNEHDKWSNRISEQNNNNANPILLFVYLCKKEQNNRKKTIKTICHCLTKQRIFIPVVAFLEIDSHCETSRPCTNAACRFRPATNRLQEELTH
jgi:hypothetical protein